MSARIRRTWEPLAWIAPALAVVLCIFVYGLVSLVDMATHLQGRFVGIDNLELTFEDPAFRTALGHNVRLLLAVPILIVLSSLIAILLFEAVRGWRWHRAVVFLPYVLPIPVIGVVFGLLLTLDGPINTALRSVGLGGLAHDWLGQPSWSLWTLTAVIVWKELGFGVILLLARLMSLSSETFEAARLDGARFWRLHTRITLPQLGSVIAFYAVTEAITMVSWVFNYVYVISNGTGGPGDATQVAELYIYQTAFQFNARELAAAAALLLFAATFVLILIFFRIQHRRKGDAHA
ncbi:carbohydrate ABC transporter permease [Conexibacter woesei]|uniref:Binding-protein-dependent transport systems inner membrane component n=1 Tax=Conexibacter woesei (strain DSM 14684 / CCUG 47730 / CIP 108061 / JCM 11494 / NBRC 100937 / ID131577) TaxID=469383 RepID=D3F740_CONWI|nr:sugar ABC transporter permease [Conexibacter woesei]ADB48811.1 binding-protein-dependent transport systems inner membrane component [Conexibacter woesei DSM 14684]